jgi:anti-sigma factor RsiW
MTPGSPRPRPGADHTAFEELAVGHALHALEPEDDLRFRAHLSACAACERAVAEHAQTLSALAYAAPSAEPPPAVLEGIRAGLATPAPVAGADLASGGDDLAARRRRKTVAVPRAWLLTAAASATALVLGLGSWAAMLANQRDEQVARGDRLAQAVEAIERPDARTVQLADGEGRVKAVVIAHGSSMSLVLDGLDPNPADTLYVVWGQDASGDVRAVGTFDVRQSELDVQRDVPLAVPLDQLTTLMVTHEHSRTPPDATSQPVLVAGSV